MEVVVVDLMEVKEVETESKIMQETKGEKITDKAREKITYKGNGDDKTNAGEDKAGDGDDKADNGDDMTDAGEDKADDGEDKTDDKKKEVKNAQSSKQDDNKGKKAEHKISFEGKKLVNWFDNWCKANPKVYNYLRWRARVIVETDPKLPLVFKPRIVRTY
jgi:hypothetical protein